MSIRTNTKVVQIGTTAIGGTYPIAIQSMTNTKTENTEATIAQILKLEAAGCTDYIKTKKGLGYILE